MIFEVMGYILSLHKPSQLFHSEKFALDFPSTSIRERL